MRSVLIGDIVAAARVLLAAPPQENAKHLALMFDRAHVAHKVSKHLGRPHPQWGNGSLMAVAHQLPQRREPFVSDPAYLAALQLVIGGLIAWRNRSAGGPC